MRHGSFNLQAMSGKKLIVVAGPTAVGKTSVAIQLAEHFKTAIISADSRQFYREMTIGTAKPTPAERTRVTHYFIDTLSLVDVYDAATFGKEALEAINKLFLTHHRVLLCGGSGLYIKAVCEGFDDLPEVPDEIRRNLIAHYNEKGITWLQDEMRALDPEYLQSIDHQNPHRLMRALEVKIYSGKSITFFQKKQKKEHAFDLVKIGLELPREELFERIDQRMDKMIDQGLFEEAKSLYPYRNHNALQTVGYQEIFDYMEKKYDLKECIRLLKRNSRRYAKRQLTWFKKDKEFVWFHPADVLAIIHHTNNHNHQ